MNMYYRIVVSIVTTLLFADAHLYIAFFPPTPTRIHAHADSSAHFPRLNWIIAALQRGLLYIAYNITIPSMHQYVTTATAEQLADRNATNSGVSGQIACNWGDPE